MGILIVLFACAWCAITKKDIFFFLGCDDLCRLSLTYALSINKRSNPLPDFETLKYISYSCWFGVSMVKKLPFPV